MLYFWKHVDIDNVGYDIVPTDGIYGNGISAIYSSEKAIKYSSKTKSFSGIINNINYIPSDTNAAKSVKKLIGSDSKNITIYQIGHHGINNDPDAINILGLNRKDVYAIAPAKNINGTTFHKVRTYFYILSNTIKLCVGEKNKLGVYCYIENTGKTLCQDY